MMCGMAERGTAAVTEAPVGPLRSRTRGSWFQATGAKEERSSSCPVLVTSSHLQPQQGVLVTNR